MNRRYFLSLLGATISLAGCSALSSSENLHQVEVQNPSDQSRQFSVTVTDEEDSVLYEETFTLDAWTANESTEPFSGTPTRISITVDGATPIETEWPSRTTVIRNGSEVRHLGEACGTSSEETITGVFVSVESADRVELLPTCDTLQ